MAELRNLSGIAGAAHPAVILPEEGTRITYGGLQHWTATGKILHRAVAEVYRDAGDAALPRP